LGASTLREPTSLPGEFREETSTSAAVDVAELYVLFRSLSSYQTEPACYSKVAEEMMAAKPITLPAESVGEMTVVSLTPPVLAITGLKVITSLISPTLVVEPVLPGIVISLPLWWLVY